MREDDTNKDTGKPRRRGFLRLAGLSGLVGGAVALVAGRGAVAGAAPAATDGPTKGYRLTDHVRQAYDTARF